MKSRLARNTRARWTLLTIFTFLMPLGVCIRPASVFAQDNAPAPQKKVNVELTTDPSPAHKGTNVVKVKLNDQTGQPITGADVAVTFYMPAMPSMGMAAVKTLVKASDQGRGMYEGKGELSSGGTWQVTITARQSGRIIATKKLTIKATGGM